MTAPTEPLVMSLEEAMRKLSFSGRVLVPGVQSWWIQDDMENHEGDSLHSVIEATWPEACEKEWGVPVVARDDAAELRAALERIERMVSPDNKGWASGATRLNHAHLIAQYALKVLPHQQEAALRAALAATEGSEPC